MADDHDNDVDAGWDDIDAGWEAEPSERQPEPSAHKKITAESEPLPSMIPVPAMPTPKPEPEPPREVFKVSEPKFRPDDDHEHEFAEDDVTANRLYDDAMLAGPKALARDEAVVTVEPLTDDDDPDAHHEVTRDRTAELMQGNETARRIKAISEETERLQLERAMAQRRRDDPTSPSLGPATAPAAPAPTLEPSGQAFEVPSPLKASGSGPAAAQPQPPSKPSAVNISLVVFVLLLVLALGAVGAVILAAFF